MATVEVPKRLLRPWLKRKVEEAASRLNISVRRLVSRSRVCPHGLKRFVAGTNKHPPLHLASLLRLAGSSEHEAVAELAAQMGLPANRVRLLEPFQRRRPALA